MVEIKRLSRMAFTVIFVTLSLNVSSQNLLSEIIEAEKIKNINSLQRVPSLGATESLDMEGDNDGTTALSLTGPPILLGISGVNNELFAEIIDNRILLKLPLKKNSSLPSGWRVTGFSSSSLILTSQSSLLTIELKAPLNHNLNKAVLRSN